MTKRKGFSTDIMEQFVYMSDGRLFWTSRAKSYKKYGHKEAGFINKNGYRYIAFNKKKYLAHHIVWLYCKHELPPKGFDIDHIDGDRANNRIENLRLLPRHLNLANSNVSRGPLPRGVQRNGSGYSARIRFNNKVFYLGTFRTPEEASEVYKRKRKELCGIYIGGRNEVL